MPNMAVRRARLFLQRFWQPTCACMTCMSGSWGNVLSIAHWSIALRTGFLTGALAVLLTFTPARALYGNRYGNAAIVACLTVLGDSMSHASRYRIGWIEHIFTGITAGILSLVVAYALEDDARRVRMVWSHMIARAGR
jgi:hypothetical protein